jgi:hypothetical protein
MRAKKLQRNLFPFLTRLTRFVFASILLLGLLLGLAGAASAYTIVFRDGQRIEVTPVFALTTTALTYEVAPGLSKTVQLSLIDVAATERANNEAPGNFVRHAAQALVASPAPVTRHAARTLTNSDLEPIRQRRIESEKIYEKRRIELGLPSIAETRRRQALEEEATLSLARRRAAEQAHDEAYWRGRASALRGEIVSVDAQINYLRSRLGGSRGPLITYGSVTTILPFGSRSFDRVRGVRARDLGTVMAPPAGAPNQTLINTGVAALRPQNPMRPSIGFGAALGSPYAFPIQPFAYGNSYERAGLSDNLNNLLVRRAGLESFWRELENEARIARVPQVWLNRQ